MALWVVGLVIAVTASPTAAWGQSPPGEQSVTSRSPGGQIPTQPPAAAAASEARVPPSADPGGLSDGQALEPDVHTVVAWALGVLSADEADLGDLQLRARLSGLVPTVGLSARHGQALDFDTQQSSLSDRVTVATDRDLTLRAVLTFDLPRLVFAREELAVQRQRRALRHGRQALLKQVIEIYFERRGLQVQLAGMAAADPAVEVRISALTALLDGFTEGRFSRTIERRNATRSRRGGVYRSEIERRVGRRSSR